MQITAPFCRNSEPPVLQPCVPDLSELRGNGGRDGARGKSCSLQDIERVLQVYLFISCLSTPYIRCSCSSLTDSMMRVFSGQEMGPCTIGWTAFPTKVLKGWLSVSRASTAASATHQLLISLLTASMGCALKVLSLCKQVFAPIFLGVNQSTYVFQEKILLTMGGSRPPSWPTRTGKFSPVFSHAFRELCGCVFDEVKISENTRIISCFFRNSLTTSYFS